MVSDFERRKKGIERSLLAQGVPPKEARNRSFGIVTAAFKDEGRTDEIPTFKRTMARKVPRKAFTRTTKNGRKVRVRKTVVTIKGKRKTVLVSTNPVFPVQDPKSGQFLGATAKKPKRRS